MSDEVTPTPAADEAQNPQQPKFKSPWEYIAFKYPNAPSQAIVESWKTKVPGGEIRFFEMPDGKRAFFIRALSGPELAGIQAEAAKLTDPIKQALELPIAIALKGVLWCSCTPTGKLADLDLRNAGAGLPGTLQAVIFDRSDFVDPAVMDQLIIDL